MSEKTFYDFKGEPIGVKEFIELYEPYYFIERKGQKNPTYTDCEICRERNCGYIKKWGYRISC